MQWLLASCRYCFRCLGCRAVLRFSLQFFYSSCHFYCHAIFIAAVHLITVQPAISRLFIQGWTLSFHFCSGPVVAIFILLLKTFSLRLQVAARYFCFSGCRFITFTLSCCSYCHCSSGSNSHSSFQALYPTLQHCSLSL